MKRRGTVGLKVTDRLFEVGDNVVPILLLLETSKGHSRTRNVLERAHEQKTHISDNCTHNACNCKAYLFGVREVLKERIRAPFNSLLLIRIGVLETLRLSRMPTEKTVATSRHDYH